MELHWAYTNTLDRLNMMPRPKCLWLNKTHLYCRLYPNLPRRNHNFIWWYLLLRLLAIMYNLHLLKHISLALGLHSSKSMWHHLYCNKMISSIHELLTAEYSRIFIQVPWTAVYIQPGGRGNCLSAVWVHENCSYVYAITLSSPPTSWCASTCKEEKQQSWPNLIPN